MKALILLGGLGTRLRPLTLARPKPLLPILNRPLIGYQLDLLKNFGVREVVLALGHKAAHFRRHLGDGRRFGLRFRYSLEKSPLGTGGAIRNALPHMEGQTIVLNGDVFAEFDLRGLARAHTRARAHATLALVSVENPAAYGLVETDAKGFVRRFVEKPSVNEITSHTVNAGGYILDPAAVARIPQGRAVSLEREVFPGALRDGLRLLGHRHEGYWSDIGTLATYWETHMHLLKAGKRPARPAGRGGILAAAGGVRLAAGVEIRGAVCLGKNVAVGKNTILEDCVILENARLGADCRIEKCVFGARVRLGGDCHVSHLVLGDGARLPDYSRSARLE